MKIRMFTILAAFILLVGCKSNTKSAIETQIEDAYNDYTKDSNKDTASKYLATVSAFLAKENNPEKSKLLVDQAIEVCKAQDLKVAEAGFISSFIKSHQDDVSNELKAVRLLDIFKSMNKTNAYNSLAAGYMYRYPNSEKGKELLKELGKLPNPDDYFAEKGKLLFGTNGNTITKGAAISYVDATEAFVMMNPNYAKSPKFLERAAEVAIAAKTYDKSLAIFDWIIQKFPNSKETPRAMFMKGLIFDDYMNKTDLARTQYEKFLNQFPNHQFAKDVQFAMETLGMTNDEIQQYLEKLRQQNATK